MTYPDYWQKAKMELSRNDSVMAGIIAQYEGETLKARGDAFYTLARSIVGQQISVKAADSIWKRLEVLAGEMKPEKITKLEEAQLREVGLSRSKVQYLQHIAEFFADPKAVHGWEEASDAEILKTLTRLRGVGQWTAEMFMIFHLLRPNILPLGDIGLINAIHKHYGKGNKLSDAGIRRVTKKWQPWSSVATWYMWRSLDPVPVEY